MYIESPTYHFEVKFFGFVEKKSRSLSLQCPQCNTWRANEDGFPLPRQNIKIRFVLFLLKRRGNRESREIASGEDGKPFSAFFSFSFFPWLHGTKKCWGEREKDLLSSPM